MNLAFPGSSTHVKLAPEAVGATCGDKHKVGCPATAQQEEDEEERPDKLHLPVPEIHMLHTQGHQQDTDQKTTKPKGGQTYGYARREFPRS